MKIEGSVALVTGAHRGLGKALVEAGAAKVYAAARDRTKISTDDPRVVPILRDTTRPEQILPGPMAQQMGALWSDSRKDFDRVFASF